MLLQLVHFFFVLEAALDKDIMVISYLKNTFASFVVYKASNVFK